MISKILQVFLFPPGFFFILVAAGFVFFLLRLRKLAVVFLSVSAACIYLLSAAPVKDVLLLPLENAYPPVHEAEGAAAGSSSGAGDKVPVVVLGGGALARSPDESYASSPSGSSIKRLLYGIRLRERYGGILLISGGMVYDREGAEPEAEAAKRIAVNLGVPEDRVIAETVSRNTWENAVEARSILPKRSDTVVLVTSAYHMRRSVGCFEEQGFTVIPAPTDYLVDRGEYSFVSPLPSAGALAGSTAALHEYWGLLYYSLRYY